jgi:hypothetical protein
MSRLQLQGVQSKYLTGLSHEFGAAVHWVLCNDSVAGNHLIELCGGLVRPKRGHLLLDDASVTPRRYAEVGTLPVRVAFPQVPVERLMNLALQQKGSNQTAGQLLGEWGLNSLAAQMAGSLDALSARRVALLLALATPRPKLLALHDVFELGLSQDRLHTHLMSASEQGAVVLVTAERSEVDGYCVSSSALAGTFVWLLQPGRLVTPQQLPDTRGDHTTHSLFVVCNDARALTEQLSRDPRVNSLHMDERANPHRVEMTGSAVNVLADAVADAVLQRNIEVRHMSSHGLPLLGASPIPPNPSSPITGAPSA